MSGIILHEDLHQRKARICQKTIITTFHRMFAIPVLFRLDRVISLPIPRPNPVPRRRAAHPALPVTLHHTTPGPTLGR